MEKIGNTTTRVRHGCASWIVAPLMMYPRKTWTTYALGPLWLLQLFFLTNSALTVGVLIWEVEGEGSHVDVGWIVCLAFMFICLAFMFICVLFTAAEIGLFHVRALHPWTFLSLQVFKSIFWLIYFAVGIATTVAQRVIDSTLIWPIWKPWQAAGLSFAFATTLAALIYGAVVLHRYRRAGLLGQLDSEGGIARKESDVSDVPWPTSREPSREVPRDGRA